MAWVTRDEVKIFLWIDLSNTDQDAKIDLLIANVQNILEDILWDLEKWTKVDKINICCVYADGTVYLQIPEVESIDKINWNTYTWVDWTDFIIDNNKVIIKNINDFLNDLEFRYFDIEYTAWYHPIPWALKEAMFILIAQEMNKTEWQSIKSYKLWPRTVQFSDSQEAADAVNSVNSIIWKYKTFNIFC